MPKQVSAQECRTTAPALRQNKSKAAAWFPPLLITPEMMLRSKSNVYCLLQFRPAVDLCNERNSGAVVPPALDRCRKGLARQQKAPVKDEGFWL
jgi:hypothetical protein